MKCNITLQPYLFFFINLFAFATFAFGQGEEKLKETFIEAESYFLFEEYKDALPLYQKIDRKSVV